MNAYEQRLDLVVEGHQLMESVGALVNSIMVHRINGKVNLNNNGLEKTLWSTPGANVTPTVGVLGLEDVDCETFDYTYVRISSIELIQLLQTDIQTFCDSLRAKETEGLSEPIYGKLEISFYQKKDGWPFQQTVPWEVWSIHVKVVSLSTESGLSGRLHKLANLERQALLNKLPDDMLQLLLIINTAVNNHEQYIPSSVNQSEEVMVFDTRFSDCQPFLFKISSSATGAASSPANTVGATVRKIFKGTLQLGGN